MATKFAPNFLNCDTIHSHNFRVAAPAHQYHFTLHQFKFLIRNIQFLDSNTYAWPSAFINNSKTSLSEYLIRKFQLFRFYYFYCFVLDRLNQPVILFWCGVRKMTNIWTFFHWNYITLSITPSIIRIGS